MEAMPAGGRSTEGRDGMAGGVPAVLEESFDRLEVYLREVQAKKAHEQKGRGGGKRRRKV